MRRRWREGEGWFTVAMLALLVLWPLVLVIAAIDWAWRYLAGRDQGRTY